MPAPLASSSTPTLPDADIGPTPEKTPGLPEDDEQDDDAAVHPPAVRNKTQFCEKGSDDFYKRYSAHWQFGYGEYSGDPSTGQISWGATGEASWCDAGPEQEEEGGEDNDPELGDDDDVVVLVDPSRRMASWAGQPDIRGRNETIRMMSLCAVHLGISFTWGVEMTCETSYSWLSFVEWHTDGPRREHHRLYPIPVESGLD